MKAIIFTMLVCTVLLGINNVQMRSKNAHLKEKVQTLTYQLNTSLYEFETCKRLLRGR